MPMAVVVVGVSHVPGVGYSVAQRFAYEGMKVGLVGRHPEKLQEAKEYILEAVPEAQVLYAKADPTNRTQVHQALDIFQQVHGPATSLVFNSACRPFPQVGVADLDVERLESDFHKTVTGALVCAQCVLPQMRDMRQGSIIFTGAPASLAGTANFGSFCAARSALRALAQSLAKEVAPEGIHVSHVIIDGIVDMPLVRERMPDITEGRLLDPDAIAELFWQLHNQPARCFTFELDARPCDASW